MGGVGPHRESLVESQSLNAFGGRKIGVARGQGEAVDVALDRDRPYFDRHVQIGGHRADQSELLRVLLPEEGDVRANEVEHLVDDLEHAREMRGASLSLEDCGHRPGIDTDKGVARIDVLGLGSVNGLDADRLEKGQIGLKVARVGFVVFARPELQGVDEDRDDHIVRRLLRGPNERKVPFVKRAHRHDKRTRAVEGAEGFRKIRFSACNFSHAY